MEQRIGAVTTRAARQIPRQLRQLWITRFDFLAGALPGKEAPTDIDQVCEKNGHFLFLECKRPHQRIERGQQITFDRLVGLSPKVRLLIVVGQPPDQIMQYGWWHADRTPRYELRDTDVWAVRDLVRRWRDWAEKQ